MISKKPITIIRISDQDMRGNFCNILEDRWLEEALKRVIVDEESTCLVVSASV